MNKPAVTRRGVYKNLEESPYGYPTPYGDFFKFSSAKKLEIYRRDIVKEVDRLERLLERHEMGGFLPEEIIQLLFRSVYRAFYRKVEG